MRNINIEKIPPGGTLPDVCRFKYKVTAQDDLLFFHLSDPLFRSKSAFRFQTLILMLCNLGRGSLSLFLSTIYKNPVTRTERIENPQ